MLFARGASPRSEVRITSRRNRLLIDPVLQFQPWLEFNRSMLRSGRLPLWNPMSGCGAPHLANGQSAVFDPFHLIAYLGGSSRSPRLDGGDSALVRRPGDVPAGSAPGASVGWGRWFAGLAFPFCGFLVAWLLFPVTNVAVWMPWVFLATDRVNRASLESADRLARLGRRRVLAGTFRLGGHVAAGLTGARHVIARLVVPRFTSTLWKPGPPRSTGEAVGVGGQPRADRSGSTDAEASGLLAWSLDRMGVGVAAVEVVPLGFYLAKSPVWGDRERERPSPWTMVRPRFLDAACTALPYLYGSQRRGQPNLAKAVGVHNLNESAGGFAGLATLIWLAPLAWSARRFQPRVRFLVGLTVFGLMGRFRCRRWTTCFAPCRAGRDRQPPVDALGRVRPGDARRDRPGSAGEGPSGSVEAGRPGDGSGWSASVALLLAWFGGDRSPRRRRSGLERVDHYSKAFEATPGADRDVYLARADRQARETLDFVPRYLGLAATQGLILAWLLGSIRRGRSGDDWGRAGAAGLDDGRPFRLRLRAQPGDRSSRRPADRRLILAVPSTPRSAPMGESSAWARNCHRIP